MGGVVVKSGKKKETAWIDPEGNILDVEASQTGLKVNGIKEKNDPGYKPTKEEIEHVINLPKEPAKVPEGLTPENAASLGEAPVKITDNPTRADTTLHETHPFRKLTITEEIDQAKKHLADLEVKKKEEIARRKAELAELEASE